MVIIYLQQKKNKETSEAYKQLLAFVPKVTSTLTPVAFSSFTLTLNVEWLSQQTNRNIK